METTIQINGLEEATSKAGKTYWKVQTSDGSMSCFEKSIADELVVGERVTIEVISSADGKFKNIRKICNKVPMEKVGYEAPVPMENKHDKFAQARAEKNTTMYVAYAKDLVVAGMNGEEAIKTIKSFIEEFS